MFIKTKEDSYYVAKIESPVKIWYPINLEIPQYGEDYIGEKLGVTDPDMIKTLQDEFLEALEIVAERVPKHLGTHVLRFAKYDWTFYLTGKRKDSVTVFLERGLSAKMLNAEPHAHPRGYAWAVIKSTDTPETINQLLYCNDIRFAKSMYRKLKKIMGW